jgi:hypothetical protein
MLFNNQPETDISIKKIFRLWSPLALTWLMIAIEGPFLAAVVARLAMPEINLAAYGVTISIAILVEAPIIMLMSASTKLVVNSRTYSTTKKFTLLLNGIVTATICLLLISGGMDYIVKELIKLPQNVAELTVKSLYILIPWPAAIGFRRFYQGLLISTGKTKFVAAGTIVRIVSMASIALVLSLTTKLAGALIAATALSAAVTLEAAATRLLSKNAVLHFRGLNSDESLSGKEIWLFYYPLALTSVVALAVNPVLSFFLSQSKMPISSLAVFPVVSSFIFMFRGTFGLSFQEISIALFTNYHKKYLTILKFALISATSATAIVLLVALTPINFIWFHTVSGLAFSLCHIARVPLIILSALPALSVLLSLQRSLLIYNKNTAPVSIATAIEVGITIIVMYLGVKYSAYAGATVAAAALLAGRVGSNSYLAKPSLKVIGFIKNSPAF